jgi:hypothetical protein
VNKRRKQKFESAVSYRYLLNPDTNAVVTVFIELPKEFDISLLEPETITLNHDLKEQI